MTQFKEGDLVQYNPDRLFDPDHAFGLIGLVVEISTVLAPMGIVPRGHTVIRVSWPDGCYFEEDPEDLVKVTEDDPV